MEGLRRVSRKQPGFADALEKGWRTAGLSGRHRTMCDFSEKLGASAKGTSRKDIDGLREAGLDDRELLDLVQVIAYYSYVNRIANALDVSLEPERGGPGEHA